MENDPIRDEDLGLKDQNELKKLKLTLETGATFFESEEDVLPAEVEANWLANIEAFEKQYANAKTTTVFDLLGQPDYKPAEELTPANITTELERLVKAMEQQGCFVEIQSPLTQEQQYRFITEELFIHETTDMRLPGMMMVYSYEEFHPNNEYDLRRYTNEFFPQVFKNKDSISPAWLNLAQKVRIGNQEYNHEEIKVLFLKLLHNFDKIEMTSFNITNVVMQEDKAIVDFEIALETIIDNSSSQLNSEGRFNYITEHGYWSICEIELPVLIF